MNDNERKVKEKYEAEGYILIHKGAPDFLCFKYDKENAAMTDIFFIEVKDHSLMSHEQLLWKCALETIGCDFYVHSSDGSYINKYFDRHHTFFKCPHCEHQILVEKEKVLEKVREMNKIRNPPLKGEWKLQLLIEDYLKKNMD